MAHGLHQRHDGELGEHILPSVAQHFSHKEVIGPLDVTLTATTQVHYHPLWTPTHRRYRLSASVIATSGATRFGIALRHDSHHDHSYHYTIDIPRQNVSFDRFPNEPWKTDNFDGVSRAFTVQSNRKITLELLVEDDVCVLYVNNDMALSARMYRDSSSPLALFAMDGVVFFDNIIVTTAGE